jgi:putative hydroxymethylpyrimidine transport system substrate-binding protein
MIRTVRQLAACALALLCLAAPAGAETPDKLSVVLDWSINPDHAPLFVAKEMGFFKKNNLDVELIEPGDPNTPPRLVAARRYDIALTYQPQLYMQVEQGLPVVRIGTLIGQPLNSLVVLRNGPVKKIEDLKGRKIGYSVAGFEEAILRAMLETHGLTLKDVTLVNVNFSLSPALMSGKVDAVIGAYRNFELNQMAIEKHPGLAFFPEKEGVPPYDELIFITHRFIAHDPRIKRFIAAVEQGVAQLKKDPNGSWRLFIKGRKTLNNELNRRAWRDTLPVFAAKPGALDHARYEAFAQFMKTQGLIKKVLPLDRYAVEIK